MNSPRILQVGLAVFLTTVALLMVELLLIRVFDVILLANIGYAAITLAMFASGLAGVVATVKPWSTDAHLRNHVAALALLFGGAIVAIRPMLNAAPMVYGYMPPGQLKAIAAGTLIYAILIIPFFLSGLVLAHAFSACPQKIRQLYFWDLAGAAAGCVIYLPFLTRFGPGGLMFWAAAASVLASACFAGKRKWSVTCALVALALMLTPVLKSDGYYEFRLQSDKRGVREAQRAGLIEFSEWGPISKIDVIAAPGGTSAARHVAYDGGSQSSYFFPFDGDYRRLRETVLAGSPTLGQHFSNRGVLASHYLKRDSGAEVLIVGSAAGQETKAALLFNPSRVDGVELVDTVVRLGRQEYADLIGHIFNDPRVENRTGEGRSYLRTTDRKYDIVQVFSNHTSSNIASGTGATTPVYLQTVEAYEEYFSHLKPDGILHINHHFYPRMITTAAHAWKLMGRSSFQSHVLVFERAGFDTLPTMLIKESPWTSSDIDDISTLFAIPDDNTAQPRLVVNPLRPDASFLSPEFFSGELSSALLKQLDYQVRPSTDDWPYFNNIQVALNQVQPAPHRFLDDTMAGSINGRLKWPLGEYAIFAAIGVIGVLLCAVCVVVPLAVSPTGRDPWPAKQVSLAYFACLGAGFIIIELVLIQIFMKLIGFPLYAFSVVICTMLAAAGLGSIAAQQFRISPARRWVIPFVGVLTCGAALTWAYPALLDRFLVVSTTGRIWTSILAIFPLAFFLGMPFPLGVLALQGESPGSVAWAWGFNALFTVVGGVMSGVLSLLFGFRMTLVIAFGLYVLAFGLFAWWRRASGRAQVPSDQQRMTRAALL